MGFTRTESADVIMIKPKTPPYSEEELTHAKTVQPEIKEWLAQWPLHAGMDLTLLVALWHVQKNKGPK